MQRVLIQNGRVAMILPPDFQPPEDAEVREAPDDAEQGFGFIDGKFVKPSKYGTLPGDPMHDQVTNENYINAQLAKQQLVISDRICVRCYEETTPVPQDWIDYRVQLRTIISMEDDTTSPPIPVPPQPAPPFPFVTIFETG